MTKAELSLATRWSLSISAVVAGLFLLYNAWTFTVAEDSIPVFSCHTMGNFECPNDAPWHGITVTTLD